MAMQGFAELLLSLVIALTPVLADRSQPPATSDQPSTNPPQATNRQPLRLVNGPDQQLSDTHQLGLDDRLWSHPSDRAALIAAIDHSLDYLQTPAAIEAYRNYALPDFNPERVRRSLERFRQLVLTTRSSEALQAAVLREFDLYQSVGTAQNGTVSFTGYFEPTYSASRVPTAEFRYPLYRLPPNFSQWPTPHPTRLNLEGEDGLQGSQSKLQGLELAWLRDRLEAYLVQVQGSARLQLTDGSTLSIGYAGRTDYPYVSVGRELVNAGKIAESDLTLGAVIEYFHQHPADLNVYLPRNNRFVFFKETTGSPAIGSLGVPVTAQRSIATDKTLMPPGALALIQTELPNAKGDATTSVSRYVLDQDTGGAIRGAGRVDLFMGTGTTAGEQAGLINHTGQLYYLLLKP
jgi:membrane-bound lytic murein transglycosylase A